MDLAGTADFQAYLLSSQGNMTMIPGLSDSHAVAFALSSAGHVAGHSSTSPDDSAERSHAFVYKDGVAKDIDTFDSYTSTAYGVNGKGQTVGWFRAVEHLPLQATGDNAHAFLFSDGVMYDLNRLLDASGDGWILNYAFSINEQGWM